MGALCCDIAFNRDDFKDRIGSDLETSLATNPATGQANAIYLGIEEYVHQLGESIWAALYPSWEARGVPHELLGKV